MSFHSDALCSLWRDWSVECLKSRYLLSQEISHVDQERQTYRNLIIGVRRTSVWDRQFFWMQKANESLTSQGIPGIASWHFFWCKVFQPQLCSQLAQHVTQLTPLPPSSFTRPEKMTCNQRNVEHPLPCLKFIWHHLEEHIISWFFATYPRSFTGWPLKNPRVFFHPKKRETPNGMPPKREEVQVGDEKWKAGRTWRHPTYSGHLGELYISPRDPFTETENGNGSPKYLSFRRWLYTPITIWGSVIGSLG